MTDARFPERWLNDRRFSRLSGDQRWGFMAIMAWSVSNRTEGVVTFDDVADIRWLNPDDMPVYVNVGLCAEVDEGWLIVDFQSTQTTRKELERQDRNRVKDRIRQQNWRANNAAVQSKVTRDNMHHVTRDEARDVTSNGLGEARLGEDRLFGNRQPIKCHLQEKPRREEIVRDKIAQLDNHETSPDETYVTTDRELELIDRNIERGYEQ